MASEYYGFNRGAELSPDKCVVGSSTGSTDVEVRIDTGKNTTDLDAILILEAIIRVLADGRFTQPPITVNEV